MNILAKLAILSLISIFLIPVHVDAIEYGGIGGRPAFPRAEDRRSTDMFVHDIESGDVIEEGITVVNNTQEKKTLLVYPADFRAASSGGFACKQLSEPKEEVGSWIDMEPTKVELEPGTNTVLEFNITVPENIDVGVHYGCMMVQEVKEESESQGLSLSFRTGVRLLLTRQGKMFRNINIEHFKVVKQDDGRKMLNAKLYSESNVSIVTSIGIQVSNFIGTPVGNFGGDYTIIKQHETEFNFEFKQPFWGGIYKADLDVGYYKEGYEVGEKTDLKTKSIRFISMPQLPALFIELAVLITILLILAKSATTFFRIRWIKKSWITKTVKKTDDIKSLANLHDVSWKLLAKVNKLTPPYIFETGQIIKAPPIPDASKRKTPLRTKKVVKKPTVKKKSIAKKKTEKSTKVAKKVRKPKRESKE